MRCRPRECFQPTPLPAEPHPLSSILQNIYIGEGERRKNRFLRPFPYLIKSRERAPSASGWAGQSGVRELPVHVKLLGVNILVTEAKPSSGETSGHHPR